MNIRLFTILPLTLALLLIIPAAQAQTASALPAGFGMSVPVNLTFNNGASQGVGALKIKGFQLVGQQVNAIGTLTFTQGGTSYARLVSVPVVFPSGGTRVVPQATCDILNLTLGPIHLDLLGLVVDLNQVVLNITAESGPGQLLGNLLCGIANLLNSPNLSQFLQQLVNALNALIGILG